MKPKLPDSVSSPQDLTALILELHEYSRWFAHEAIKQRVHARTASQAPILSPATTDVLRGWRAGNPLTAAGLSALIKTLEEYKTSAPTVTLTLAAPPTNGIKSELVAWCRTNLADDVLVNFQFNSTLLGGMVVRSGSRVFDWSFRRHILDSRQHFPEVLRNV